MYTPSFKALEQTLWWVCPHCGQHVHVTRKRQDGSVMAGRDFPCGNPCPMRHCLEWRSSDCTIEEAMIYSYQKHLDDMSKLPLLAQL